MLSTAAWNAFLKTLEEPPPNTVFVLATTEAQKVPATVVDRCHRFDFHRPRSSRSRRCAPRRAGRVDRDPARGGRRGRPLGDGQLPRRARHARAAASPTAAARSRSRTCSRCSAWPTRACSKSSSTPSPRATRAGRCSRSSAACEQRPRRRLVRRRPRGARARAAGRADARRAARRTVAHRGGRRAPARAGRARATAPSSCACSSCSARRSRACAPAPTRARGWSWPWSRRRAPRSTPRTPALLARIERLERERGGVAARLRRFAAAAPCRCTRAPRCRDLPPGRRSGRRASPRRSPVAAEPAPAAEAAPTPARRCRADARPQPAPAAEASSRRSAAARGRRARPTSSRCCAVWPAVVDVVRADNALLGALIADARPVGGGRRGPDRRLRLLGGVPEEEGRAPRQPRDRLRGAAPASRAGAGGSPTSCSRLDAELAPGGRGADRGGVGEALHGGVRRRGAAQRSGARRPAARREPSAAARRAVNSEQREA